MRIEKNSVISVSEFNKSKALQYTFKIICEYLAYKCATTKGSVVRVSPGKAVKWLKRRKNEDLAISKKSFSSFFNKLIQLVFGDAIIESRYCRNKYEVGRNYILDKRRVEEILRQLKVNRKEALQPPENLIRIVAKYVFRKATREVETLIVVSFRSLYPKVPYSLWRRVIEIVFREAVVEGKYNKSGWLTGYVLDLSLIHI